MLTKIIRFDEAKTASSGLFALFNVSHGPEAPKETPINQKNAAIIDAYLHEIVHENNLSVDNIIEAKLSSFSNDTARVVFDKNVVIQGISFLANEALSIDVKKCLQYGTLAFDQEIDIPGVIYKGGINTDFYGDKQVGNGYVVNIIIDSVSKIAYTENISKYNGRISAGQITQDLVIAGKSYFSGDRISWDNEFSYIRYLRPCTDRIINDEVYVADEGINLDREGNDTNLFFRIYDKYFSKAAATSVSWIQPELHDNAPYDVELLKELQTILVTFPVYENSDAYFEDKRHKLIEKMHEIAAKLHNVSRYLIEEQRDNNNGYLIWLVASLVTPIGGTPAWSGGETQYNFYQSLLPQNGFMRDDILSKIAELLKTKLRPRASWKTPILDKYFQEVKDLEEARIKAEVQKRFSKYLEAFKGNMDYFNEFASFDERSHYPYVFSMADFPSGFVKDLYMQLLEQFNK